MDEMVSRGECSIDSAEQRSIQTRDGVTIAYQVVGQGDRTLLLANGLGGRLYVWRPLIEALGDRYRLISWDYRGLFDSPCDQASRLSVRDHALDGLELLDAEGVDRATWIGWSMGVQVSLEAASFRPERFAGMVLMNGTYGQVFNSGFQPLFRLPLLPRYLHEITEWVRRYPVAARMIAAVGKRGTVVTVGLFWLVVGRRALELRSTLQQYNDDVYAPENFPNFLRLFQELDSHSVYHHLPRIDVPALVVSGRFDILTPPYQSREIARRLPNAEHVHIGDASHFVLIERPAKVVERIEGFLKKRASW